MQEPKQALDRSQAMALNRLAMRVGFRFSLIMLVIGLLFGVVEFIVVKPSESDSSDSTLTQLLATSVVVEFAGCYLMAKWLLLRFLLPATKGQRLRLTQNKAAFNFRPYVWRWFLAVCGGLLACGAIAGLCASFFKIDPSGIAMGVTVATFYGATYYILMRLIKSGDAVLEAAE